MHRRNSGIEFLEITWFVHAEIEVCQFFWHRPQHYLSRRRELANNGLQRKIRPREGTLKIDPGLCGINCGQGFGAVSNDWNDAATFDRQFQQADELASCHKRHLDSER